MRTDPNRKYYRLQRLSASDLFFYFENTRPDLWIVFDHKHPAATERPYLRVVSLVAIQDQPDRFTPITTTDELDAELRSRGVFVGLSPGGWLQIRKLPEDY